MFSVSINASILSKDLLPYLSVPIPYLSIRLLAILESTFEIVAYLVR